MLEKTVALLVLAPRGLSCFQVASVLFALTNEWSLAASVTMLVIFYTLRASVEEPQKTTTIRYCLLDRCGCNDSIHRRWRARPDRASVPSASFGA